MRELRVRLKFTDELWGFVYDRAEFDILPFCAKDKVRKFERTADGKPFLHNWIVKGFLREACRDLHNDKSTKSSKLDSINKVIDCSVFVSPRKIPINTDKEITISECRLRAETAMGERTMIEKFETVAPGTTMEFNVQTPQDDLVPITKECLEHGAVYGIGYGRCAGIGRFSCEILEVS